MLLLPLFRIGQPQLQDISILSLSRPPTNTRVEMCRYSLGCADHEMLLNSGAPLAGPLPRSSQSVKLLDHVCKIRVSEAKQRTVRPGEPHGEHVVNKGI
jgi:hypothetical protein